MEVQTNKITIDLNLLAAQLRGEISSDLKSLQIIDDAIIQENYSTNSYTLRQGFLESTVSIPPPDFLKQRELNKCFKSIIGSLQDFMDKLIAAMRFSEENINLHIGHSKEELDSIFQKISDLVVNVSTDHSLNIPRKLDIIFSNSKNEEIKVSIQSYFDVRNGLEHHKGIAKIKRLMTYKRLALASTAGYEVTPPAMLGLGEGLVLKSFSENIIYDKGGNLIITRTQLDGIILNLLIFVIPRMIEDVETQLNHK